MFRYIILNQGETIIMTKKIITLALAAMMVFSLAACSNSGTNYDFDLTEYITLGEDKGIEISKAKVGEKLAETVDVLLESAATKIVITDRAAKEGDIVNIDFVGKLDGEEIKDENGLTPASDEAVDVTIGDGAFVEGFEESIVGHLTGDAYTVDITFPEDYLGSALAGKTVAFDITVNSITEKILPEYNNDLIKEKTSYDTIPKFEAQILKSIREEMVWNALSTSSVVKKYPEENVKFYYDQTVAQYKQMAGAYGYSFDSFVEAMMQTSTKTFLQQVINESKTNVRNEMILHSFLKAESIELTKEVYDSRIGALVEEYAVKDAKELEKNYGKEMIENTMLYDIMIEKLLEYAVEVE